MYKTLLTVVICLAQTLITSQLKLLEAIFQLFHLICFPTWNLRDPEKEASFPALTSKVTVWHMRGETVSLATSPAAHLDAFGSARLKSSLCFCPQEDNLSHRQLLLRSPPSSVSNQPAEVQDADRQGGRETDGVMKSVISREESLPPTCWSHLMQV